jgi:tetratricopeptide (TPR) repeat protein
MCDLLLDLCDALYLTGEDIRITDAEAPAAFALAESISDASRACRACRIASDALAWTVSLVGPQFAEWAARADRYAPPGTVERALADVMMGASRWFMGDARSGRKLLDAARDLAIHLGDREVATLAIAYLLFFLRSPQRTSDRLRLAEELWTISRAGLATRDAVSLQFALYAFLDTGQRQRAEAIAAEMRTMAERTGEFHLNMVSAGIDAVLAFMDGRLEDAADMAAGLRGRGEALGDMRKEMEIGTWATFAESRALICLGAPLQAMEQRYLKFGPRSAITTVVQAHLGRREEVAAVLEDRVVKRPHIGTDEDETFASMDTLLLEASVITGHVRAAELLVDRLRVTELCTTGVAYPTCLSRHLGGACALLKRYDEARRHYQEAIRVCTEMRFRPELALSRLQLAELLLERYPDEKKEALEHLDFAIKEFREMKMQPSLDRALKFR